MRRMFLCGVVVSTLCGGAGGMPPLDFEETGSYFVQKFSFANYNDGADIWGGITTWLHPAGGGGVRSPWVCHESRPRQIVLGNFLATFLILSNFLANEQLRATFPKVSILLATLSLFEPRSRIFKF